MVTAHIEIIQLNCYLITGNKTKCKIYKSFDHEYESQDSKFIDYSKSGVKSDMLDCFIWSQGEFFLGSASGPANVPPMFGRPGCYTNIYPYNSCFWFHKNDISIVKPLYNTRSQKYLSLVESFKCPIYDPVSTSALKEQGLELHFKWGC